MDQQTIKQKIYSDISALLQEGSKEVTDEMPLIGSGSLLDSMKIVELCINLEDLASNLGFEFDWTSDTAMSKSRSMFKTAGTLASEFLRQMEEKK